VEPERRLYFDDQKEKVSETKEKAGVCLDEGVWL